ncbi:MAG TPA: TM1812 family CRISPR-associated protein [Methanospirillum sp.]|nr:TM1812 family CRISPR-associated protein [Methanospirillum sp.]
MRCITFIGKDPGPETRFCRDEHCISTDLVQEAVWHLWSPEEMILCISDPKHAYVASVIESRNIVTRNLWIPTGTRENELWEIFSLLTGIVEDDEEILFEITAGCHALPFLVFPIAAFLKEIKGVRLAGIVYASPEDEYGLCHMVDLKPMIGVANWISGVKALTQYTDAEPIRQIMTGLQDDIQRSRCFPDPPTHLTGWSHLLETFTQAVRLSRPNDALYAGWGITQKFPAIREELSRFAPALLPVIRKIESIGEIGSSPLESGLTHEYLMKQYDLIVFQIDKGLDLQAVSLAREWIVSAVILFFGQGENWLDGELRHQISQTLTGGALILQKEAYEKTQYSELLYSGEDWPALVRVWMRISDLRNDLAHCGMNERDESLRSIHRRTVTIPEDLLIVVEYTKNGNPAGERSE